MDAVEDVKSKLNIEDVIGEYVQLKRAGRNFKGLSPFSNEKTPSFVVSPDKNIWHDFSSGRGGDIFTFVMEVEGLDFKAALDLLARKAGVDLTQYQKSTQPGQGKQKERLLAALELAAKFYQVQFKKNQTALEYIFKKRAFSKETALQFRIGYSPNTSAALHDFLRGKGFSDQEIKQAGLSTHRYSGVGDMFQGRIMIPLMDAVGKVIGFTARLLEDDSEAPKYINTPATLLYDKSRHVFGLHLAKEAIRKTNHAVIVEGQMDVIASHQAGVKEVVATAGTAITQSHLQALGRLTPDIRLCFDQDKAGVNATERAIPLASKASVTLSIIDIPVGKDPDELVRKDPDSWRAVIDKKMYALDWLIERHQKRLDLSSALGKRQFSDVLLPIIRQLDDTVEQDHYLGQIADLIGVSTDALRAKLTRVSTTAPRRRHALMAPAVAPNTVLVDTIKLQNQLLALALGNDELREYLQPLTLEMLPQEPAQAVLTSLQAGQPLHGNSDYVKMLELLFEEFYRNLETQELRYEATRLQVRLIEQYVKAKKAVLAAKMRASSEADMFVLLEQAKQLDTLLKAASSDQI